MATSEISNRGQAPALTSTTTDELNRLTNLKKWIHENLVEGVDYGIFAPSTKRALFKPGAEKLLLAHCLRPHIEILDRTIQFPPALGSRGFVSYDVRVTIINKRTDVEESDGIGTCNSTESMFKNTKDVITAANTILRKAKKRALVDGTITALRLAGIFEADDFQAELDNRKERASRDLLTRANNLRSAATAAGYRTQQGAEPKPVADGATRREVEMKMDRWAQWLRDHAPATEPAGPDPLQVEEGLPAPAPGSAPADAQLPLNQLPRDKDAVRLVVPKNPTTGTCNKCRAQIIWIPTGSGGAMPCNPDGYMHLETCPRANRGANTQQSQRSAA